MGVSYGNDRMGFGYGNDNTGSYELLQAATTRFCLAILLLVRGRVIRFGGGLRNAVPPFCE